MAKPASLLTVCRASAGRVAVVATLLVASFGCSADSDESVVFGLMGPFQKSYGESMRLGAELARSEINAGDGINGRPLEFRLADDNADPEKAPTVAETLYTDPEVVAVVGPVNSGTTLEAASVFNRGTEGLVTLATSATSPAISGLGPWTFRVASSDSANAVALAQTARQLNPAAAILYENDGYGRGLASSFVDAYTAAGGRILGSDPYLGDTQDLTPYLQRLQRRGARLIFVAGLEEGAARIIRQAGALGLEARFLGGDGMEGLVSMGPAYNGALVGLLFHPEASPAAEQFARRFREKFEREADSFAALGYDAVHLLALAIEEGGTDRTAVQSYLSRLGQPNGAPAFKGVTGEIKFDEQGDPAGKAFQIGVIRNGSIALFQPGQ